MSGTESLAWWAHSSKTSQGGSAVGAALETPARGPGRGTGVPGAGLSRPLLPPCRYPHDMVNHLSCHEARNHYGGVVSLIPIVLDLMKEWVAHSEKLPRKALQHVSEPQAATRAAARAPQATGTQPRLRKDKCGQPTQDSLKPRGKNKECSKPPWRPPGGKLTQPVTCLIPIPSCPIPSRGALCY